MAFFEVLPWHRPYVDVVVAWFGDVEVFIEMVTHLIQLFHKKPYRSMYVFVLEGFVDVLS